MKNLTLRNHFHKLNYVQRFPHVFNCKKANILCVAGTMYGWCTEHSEKTSSKSFKSIKYLQTHPTDTEED